MSQPSNLFAQMRQRNVFRIGTMYIVGAWLLLQFGEVMIEIMELPNCGLVVRWSCYWHSVFPSF